MTAAVAAVVLAAGEASRYGAPKQLLLLPDVLASLAGAPVDEVVVVEGAYPLPPCGDRLPGLPCRVVRCTEWELGPGASLRCGLAALGGDVEAAVVVLADGPELAAESVARVVGDWRANGGAIVAASYGGVRGHPLLVTREAWGSVPDEGLRALTPRLVACDDLGAPGDVDRPEDLPARLRQASGGT
ncbi:MAG TPA: nucleotidyltransferase family protein [Gaiella sp.]|jgi:nicotine blue oxidoreductase